jgi:hypothetical protein
MGSIIGTLIMYQLTKENACIKRIADNAFIPFDPANTDYAEYLKWVLEGNQPLPAEVNPV